MMVRRGRWLSSAEKVQPARFCITLGAQTPIRTLGNMSVTASLRRKLLKTEFSIIEKAFTCATS